MAGTAVIPDVEEQRQSTTTHVTEQDIELGATILAPHVMAANPALAAVAAN